jgi:SPP1 family predicted phage head-tail adaptor
VSRPPIGAFRRRVRLEEPVATPDGAGGIIESWSPLAELWAAGTPLQGGEGLSHDRTAGHLTYEVWVRRRDDIRPACRLVDGTRILDIEAVFEEAGPRRWLRCLAVERRL